MYLLTLLTISNIFHISPNNSIYFHFKNSKLPRVTSPSRTFPQFSTYNLYTNRSLYARVYIKQNSPQNCRFVTTARKNLYTCIKSSGPLSPTRFKTHFSPKKNQLSWQSTRKPLLLSPSTLSLSLSHFPPPSLHQPPSLHHNELTHSRSSPSQSSFRIFHFSHLRPHAPPSSTDNPYTTHTYRQPSPRAKQYIRT